MEAVQTERLELVPWSAADTEALAAINADPEVMRYIGRGETLSPEASDAVSSRIVSHWKRFGFGQWAVRPREGAFAGRTIGFTGLSHPLWLPGEEQSVEVGWRLARGAWGHGYATEAARAAVRAGFERLGLPEIISLIDPRNLRSQRVAMRLGMFLERAVAQPGELRDLLVWALRAD